MSTGAQISTLAELIRARESRRAVTVPAMLCFAKPRPAAFVANMSGDLLHRMMVSGMFIYVPEKRPKITLAEPVVRGDSKRENRTLPGAAR